MDKNMKNIRQYTYSRTMTEFGLKVEYLIEHNSRSQKICMRERKRNLAKDNLPGGRTKTKVL